MIFTQMSLQIIIEGVNFRKTPRDALMCSGGLAKV